MSRNRGGLEGVWRWVGDLAHPEGGRVVRSECNRYDTVKQRISSKLRYEQFSESGELLQTHLMSLELAYLYPGDMRDLLTQAGFQQVKIDGGFEGEPVTRDGDELAILAVKP